MKWSNNDLMWGRPLRAILALFNGEKLPFSYYHLSSSDSVNLEYNLSMKSKKIAPSKNTFLF